MRLFGGEQISKIMTAFKLPEDTPIEHGMVSKAIENAQVKVEGHNFEIRKHLVEYDDVANKQREVIYSMRKQVLTSARDKDSAQKIKEDILEKTDREIENVISAHSFERIAKSDYGQIVKEISTIVPFADASQERLLADIGKIKDQPQLSKFLQNVIRRIYSERESSLTEAVCRDIEKYVTLSVIDTLWISHLDTLDDLREGIGLRAAGQRDPLVEYKQEAFSLFEKLTASIDYEIVHRIFKIQVSTQPAIEKVEDAGVQIHEEPQLAGNLEPTEKSSRLSGNPVINQPIEKDPNEMSDEELNAEIARLEALESGTQSATIPENPMMRNPDNLPLKAAKIGRNDPCPCGAINPETGKTYKYKKCGMIDAPHHKG